MDFGSAELLEEHIRVTARAPPTDLATEVETDQDVGGTSDSTHFAEMSRETFAVFR